MTLKLAQFCDDPPKMFTKSSYPQKIFIFLKTKNNIEIQNFESQKMDRAYVCVKISEFSKTRVCVCVCVHVCVCGCVTDRQTDR